MNEITETIKSVIPGVVGAASGAVHTHGTDTKEAMIYMSLHKVAI